MALIEQLDAKIYQALIDHLKTMSGGYDIVEPNETYPTSAADAFIVTQDVRFEPVGRCIGDETANENRGMFALAVMVPLEWSHAQALGIGGTIRSHFPKSLRLYYDDVKVEILATPFVSANAVRDEAWYRLPVSIRWRCSG